MQNLHTMIRGLEREGGAPERPAAASLPENKTVKTCRSCANAIIGKEYSSETYFCKAFSNTDRITGRVTFEPCGLSRARDEFCGPDAKRWRSMRTGEAE
jgi:hypothetical protein